MPREEKQPAPAGPLTAGDPAPNFTLSDQKGERHSLSEYRSEWVLLYFFSKDEIDACREGSCRIRDDFATFRRRRVHAMGISTENVQANYTFSKQFELPFRVLADPEKKVAKLYGVSARKTREGKEYESSRRATFLVSPRGVIEKAYLDPDPEKHAEEVLADLMKIPETQDRRFSIADMHLPGDRRFKL